MTRLQANPTLLLAPALFEMMDANGREELSGKIRETYFKGQPIDKEIMDDIADVSERARRGSATWCNHRQHLSPSLRPLLHLVVSAMPDYCYC